MKKKKIELTKHNRGLLLSTATLSASALLVLSTPPVVHADTTDNSQDTASTTTPDKSATTGNTTVLSASSKSASTDNSSEPSASSGASTAATTIADNDVATKSNTENNSVSSMAATSSTKTSANSEKSSDDSSTKAKIDVSPANTATESDNSKDINTNKGETKNSNSTKPELKGEVKEIAKKAGIDVNKLTADQINELNKIDLSKKDKDGAQLTYSDFKRITQTLVDQDPRYAVPFFNASKIKNMPATRTVDAETGKVEDLEVWDSWPVQNARTGYVSNWNDYQLVIAMMGVPKTNDNHIYLLYNKYGDNDFSHWKNAGSIFGLGDTTVQQWSGSATLNNDGSIQLYYTKVDHDVQKIASATIYLNLEKARNEISINRVENDHVLFEGDGYHYQTRNQWKENTLGGDNSALRDAHVIEDENGNRYLVFEASTGTENYEGLDQLYKWENYGGSDKDNLKDFLQVLSNPDIKNRARWANAAIGILKLNNNTKNPSVEKVYSPLMSAPMVSDEIERPDVVHLGNKYYLFAATRLNHGSDTDAWMKANKTVGDNVAMIGYVSDNLTHGYVPLNDTGVVLTASVPANWRTATYSYYAVPVEGRDDQVLVTSYITNRDGAAGDDMHSTWAPSFLVQINPDNTTTVLAKMTNQGDWIWDNGSENPEMLGVLDKNAPNSAALPGEWDKPIDWNLIGNYLKPHTPLTPDTPTIVNNTKTPRHTPNVPAVTNTPATPNTPDTPQTPTTYKHVTRPELPRTGANNNGMFAAVVGGLSSLLGLIGLSKESKRKRRN